MAQQARGAPTISETNEALGAQIAQTVIHIFNLTEDLERSKARLEQLKAMKSMTERAVDEINSMKEEDNGLG